MKRKIIFFDFDYLVENGIPSIDYHSHTRYTDGSGTPLEYAKEAEKKRLSAFAITEHVWKSSMWVENLLNEISVIKETNEVEIFAGLEAKQINMSGCIDVTRDNARKVSIVLGSVHGYPTKEDYNYVEPKNLTPKKALETETNAILALIENNLVDVIAHPYILYKKHFGGIKIPNEFSDKVIKSAIDNKVALEINGKYGVPDKEFIKSALMAGAKISLGSDAHKPTEIGSTPTDVLKNIMNEIRSQSPIPKGGACSVRNEGNGLTRRH